MITKFLGWPFDSERMRTSAALDASFASFVFPVTFVKGYNVNTPDYDRASRLNRLRWVNEITPDDIPPGVVIVGLNGPGPLAALAFETFVRRWVLAGASFVEIRKPLLSGVAVSMFFVSAETIKGFGSEDSNNGAEYIGLFVVEVDKVSQRAFDVVDRSTDRRDVEPRRERRVRIEVVLVRHGLLARHIQRGQFGYGLLREHEVFLIDFQPDALEPERSGRRDRGAGAHKGVENDSLAQWK